ncbi:hypothetical protein LVD15_22955 [Fulvivirga maritima]|uniref:hypothetical protein n=1 Tax=Fulvivirga maritima TaxID=2904247 RepID=UPI001F29F2A4|nr:hypothetical protein [Fulvivirga maritima]UII26133.1 hypothetical protein LVD15_22955 [Fulvivirga maritima]
MKEIEPNKEEIVDNNPFERMREDYVTSYSNTIETDTVANVSGKEVMITLKHYCLFDSAVVLPNKYIWGSDSLQQFITHNYVTDIVVTNLLDTLVKQTASKQDFQLSEELKKYGVLKKPHFRRVDSLTNELILHYSISIPITDIGVGKELRIKLKE